MIKEYNKTMAIAVKSELDKCSSVQRSMKFRLSKLNAAQSMLDICILNMYNSTRLR